MLAMAIMTFIAIQSRNEAQRQRAEAEGLVAADPKTRDLLLLASRVAKTDATVLLTGESGTGKELIAHAMHYSSPSAKKPFVKVSCAATIR